MSIQILTNHQFRKLIQNKKINVTVESKLQNIKNSLQFEKTPKIIFSKNQMQIGTINEGALFGPPCKEITQNANIIEIQTIQEGTKWTIEILENIIYTDKEIFNQKWEKLVKKWDKIHIENYQKSKVYDEIYFRNIKEVSFNTINEYIIKLKILHTKYNDVIIFEAIKDLEALR